MAYKIPAKTIRNILKWGRNHSYDYESFIKTIKKDELLKFYSFYKRPECLDLSELKRLKKREIFEIIEKCLELGMYIFGSFNSNKEDVLSLEAFINPESYPEEFI